MSAYKGCSPTGGVCLRRFQLYTPTILYDILNVILHAGVSITFEVGIFDLLSHQKRAKHLRSYVEKVSIPPPPPPMEGHWKFLEGGGAVLKAKLLEEKYEVTCKLEFPGGGGGGVRGKGVQN